MTANKSFAVCGRPVLHSQSPQIFNNLFSISGIPACYTRITSKKAEDILETAKELGISGLNVTAPFKADMFRLMDVTDEVSNSVKAVNTVLIRDGKCSGFNTDCKGVSETLKQNNIDIENRDCLVLGYGNAAAAAVHSLKNNWKTAHIFVTGRSFEKAKIFAGKFNCSALDIKGIANIKPYLILSTLPGDAFVDIRQYLKFCNLFFDASYNNSYMTQEASRYDVKIIEGEQWLINQALASYKIFTDCKPPEFNFSLLPKNEIKKRVFLTGFSGSGKSHIGKLLAEKLNYNFLDTDNMIVEREGMNIPEIFELKGEEYFRKTESTVLDELCSTDKAVISCGGGTLCNSKSIGLAKVAGSVIWIYAKIDECLKRININEKPMLNAKSKQEIIEIFNKRNFWYCTSSDLIVPNKNDNSDAMDNILFELINLGY